MNNHEIESNLENEDPRVICRTRDRGVVVCIGETAGDPQSLQNAFKGWKKSKQKAEKKRAKEDAAMLAISPPDPGRKLELRTMFLEIVKGYIGVPYGKKHHEPDGMCVCEGCTESGRQLRADPMFLDCCGLVRRAIRQMRRQLGFRLGPGNQAYQYDTLPLRVGSIAELEPGDLVFYSGTPYSPEAKRYKFDMTHVEVFVGGSTGEATIGSRERFKWVKEYDSYRFTSVRWALIAYHFVKLDTWLEGICQPEHPEWWSERSRGSKSGKNKHSSGETSGGLAGDSDDFTRNSKKYSIFTAADGEDGGDDDDEQAGDD